MEFGFEKKRKVLKVHCERISRSLLRGKRARWKPRFFIACAIALKAEMVITGDLALKGVGQYQGIKIVTPEQFLRLHRFQ